MLGIPGSHTAVWPWNIPSPQRGRRLPCTSCAPVTTLATAISTARTCAWHAHLRVGVGEDQAVIDAALGGQCVDVRRDDHVQEQIRDRYERQGLDKSPPIAAASWRARARPGLEGPSRRLACDGDRQTQFGLGRPDVAYARETLAQPQT